MVSSSTIKSSPTTKSLVIIKPPVISILRRSISNFGGGLDPLTLKNETDPVNCKSFVVAWIEPVCLNIPLPSPAFKAYDAVKAYELETAFWTNDAVWAVVTNEAVWAISTYEAVSEYEDDISLIISTEAETAYKA